MRSLGWGSEEDSSLAALLDQPSGTQRKAAEQMGVSQSFLQRRARKVALDNIRLHCTPDRATAGEAPLPAHHPITWQAIALPSVPCSGIR